MTAAGSEPEPVSAVLPAAALQRKIFIATSNAGKERELQALFTARGILVARYLKYTSPLEGELSYAANASLKARALYDLLGTAGCAQGVLADDSGLEVAALSGRPGVATADYAGAATSWSARRAMLLRELAATGSRDRRARFVCAMHFIDPNGREFAALGTLDGEIAGAERGELGFSFDPIFLYLPAAKTFGELTDEQKNSVSHRAIAAAAIAAALDAAAVRLPQPR